MKQFVLDHAVWLMIVPYTIVGLAVLVRAYLRRK